MKKSAGSQTFFIWFSGFFGLAALAHLTRAAIGLEFTVEGFRVPMAASWVVGLLSLGLSLASLQFASKGECCGSSREHSHAEESKGCCH